MKRPYPLDFKDQLDMFTAGEVSHGRAGAAIRTGPSDEFDSALRDRVERLEHDRLTRGGMKPDDRSTGPTVESPHTTTETGGKSGPGTGGSRGVIPV